MFTPYAIKHIQLNELGRLSLPPENHYFVFWHRHFPLGHLWYDGSVNEHEFSVRVVDAVAPALDAYSDAACQRGYHWRDILFGSDPDLPSLDRLLIKLPFPKVTPQPITVVICTRNRPTALSECIGRLRRSDDMDFELLVVDNASDTDETRQVVASFDGVRYIREERKGLDIARNAGIRHATHDIVAFTDDDVMVGPDWITRIKEGFENPQTMALTGLTIPLELVTEAQYIFEAQWGFNKGYLPRLFDADYVRNLQGSVIPAWDVGAGANMAFRKDIFKIAGGFDERLDVGASGCSGDSEMWYRILAEGWSCLYLPQVVVYHQHRRSMDELHRQLHAYMKGHVSSLFVQHEKYGHRNNLRRIRRDLPRYYARRFCRSLQSLDFRSLRSWYGEVSGCVAGWRFYRANPVNRDMPLFEMPEKIQHPKAGGDELISVVITCHNYGHFLQDAIDSVRRQRYRHVQIVVIDDGSTDQTAQVCAMYPDIEYVYTKHLGVSNARNTGVLYCRGDYILFLDADDLLDPEALSIQRYFLNYYPDIAFVSGGFERVDQNLKPLKDQPALRQCKDDFYRHLLTGNFIGMQSNTLYRREVFFDFYFDSKLNGSEDYDLNLRISRHLPAFSHTQKVAKYRVHANSLSSDPIWTKGRVLKALSKQLPVLRTPEEKAAYEAGVSNWTTYYQSL